MQKLPATQTRRGFLATSAAVAALPLAGNSSSVSAQESSSMVRAIASGNGRPATQRAYEQITSGQDTLESVVAGVNLVEDDPNDMTVGYGGLPNELGIVELDAAVMHGPSSGAGSVASLRGIRHPSSVARLVMLHTDHIMLVGKGALKFALAHGFKKENLLTDKARERWLEWKRNLSDRDDWLPTPTKGDQAGRRYYGDEQRPTGTIHCAGINAAGDISCVTTTSGLAYKIPGRVGDSPIIGAGLYLDNEVGSCGATGRGEEAIRNVCSFAAVELMRSGRSPEEAGLEVMRRVVRHAPRRLLDESGGPKFGLNLYLLRKDGAYAGVHLRGESRFAVTDEQGTRLEDSVPLIP